MKIIKKIVCLIALFNFCFIFPKLFDHDRAVIAAQKNDWQKADDIFTNIVTDSIDNPEVLYDAGVAAYKVKKFEIAQAHFDSAIHCPTISDKVKEKSLFNGGNCCVDQKKLEDAIGYYEKTLALNSHNLNAQHNLDMVKKMLEQKKQKDKSNDKKQNQKKDKNKKQDKKEKNSSKNQNNQGDESSKDSSSNDAQGKKESKDNKKSNGGPEKKEQNNKGAKQGEGKAKNQSESNEKRNQQKTKKTTDKKEQQQNSNGKQHNDPKNKKEKNASPQNTKQDKKEQENKKLTGNVNNVSKKYDDEVMKILSAIENKDTQGSKQMMKVRMQKTIGKYNEFDKNY